MPLLPLQQFWKWIPQSSSRRPRRKLTRKRHAFFEPLEDRSLLASLVHTFLPDAVGPQREAAFGYRVAASDSYYVIGAPSTSTSHIDSGEVLVYNPAGEFVSRIENPTPGTNDNFDSAVAVVGNLVVVGAWQDDFSSTDSGRAYVFQAETGEFLFNLQNPNPSSFDEFGYSVAADGNRIVIGTPGEDFVATDAGELSVYSTTGAYQYKISNPDAAAGDRFSAALALKGNILVVGAPGDDTTGADSGRVYLYNNGVPFRTLENPSPGDGDQFGSAVAIAGNYVVVGTPFDDAGASDAGAVHLFDIVTGDFIRTVQHPAAAAGDQFGVSVGLSGDQLLVGAASADEATNGADAGRAFLFSAATGSLVSTINNPSPQAGDAFGADVAISSSGYVIGSPGDDTGATDSGLTFLYNSTTGPAGVAIPNPTLQAQSAFGSAVAIAGDWYVVGSPGDDRVATNSGEVHVYSATNGTLLREYFAPANSTDAAFGAAVAVSGNILAVGAPGLQVGGVNAGAVMLFDLSSGLFLRTIENPTPAAGDLFGKSLSFEGNRLVVGAPLDDTQATDNGVA